MSAAPPHAIKCWVDANNLYFELPSLNAPCVLAFPRTGEGFSKALSVLFVRHATEGHGKPYSRSQPSLLTPDKNGITGMQRSNARDVLKRMKIL
jgi:hypothetical protein